MKKTVIPATLELLTSNPLGEFIKKRTAGYARVSSDKEEQENSFEAQVDHYTRFIQNNPEWEFVGLYSDEGLSAISTKKETSGPTILQVNYFLL